VLFAHLKRILGISRLRLTGPHGAKDEFRIAATVQKPPQARDDSSRSRLREVIRGFCGRSARRCSIDFFNSIGGGRSSIEHRKQCLKSLFRHCTQLQANQKRRAFSNLLEVTRTNQ
jgi:hypothetical protein